MLSGVRVASGWPGVLICSLILLSCAAPPQAESSSRAMGLSEARHLLSRTGFGVATITDIRDYASLSRQEAVDRLLSSVLRQPVTPPPVWVDDRPVTGAERRDMTGQERQLLQQQRKRRGEMLKGWWYQEMVVTPSPFTERMTLFWHNHFTSSLKKVREPVFLYRQNLLLRAGAFGDFRELARMIARDPAMLIYLDGNRNSADAPNENFARELFELFTLGPGNYTERDIREAARAFSGVRYNQQQGVVRQNRKLHDDGIKTVFGQSGSFSVDEVLDIVFQQPAAARFIAAKLWREFVSPEPDLQEIEAIAGTLRRSGYSITAALRHLLTSDGFYDLRHRGMLVKSPVDMLVGTIRLFGLVPESTEPLVRMGRELGQDIFDPPTVKGWDGGTDWINSTTLLTRQDLIRRFSMGAGRNRMAGRQRLTELVESDLSKAELVRLLLPVPPLTPVPADASRGKLLTMTLSDPVFQLK